MGRHEGKASRGLKQSGRGSRFPHNGDRPQRSRYQGASLPEPEAILKALGGQPQGATASQLAAAMGRPGDSRELGAMLKRLLDQGKVLEVRPGRYQASGTGGEFSVVLSRTTEGVLLARFPDGSEKAVNPRYALGAGPGDVVQALVGEDDHVLVTRMLRRSGRELVGLVNFRPGGMVMVPDNRREGELPVFSCYPRFHDEYQAGDRVVATVVVDAGGQSGVHLARILGPQSPEVEDFRHVCLLHDLPGDHPAAVEAEAKAFPDAFPLGEHREDLRNQLIFTIDPATAKDFDDAISLKQNDDGTVELGVHIADVSNYVREETALDAEAAIRGTSIYLINRVIPMLPEVLSNGLCSLKPDVDRYCLSAFLTLDRSFKLVKTRVAQSLIRSRQRLTYEQALAVLERRDPGLALGEDLVAVLRQVSGIAQGLRKAREQAGALNLFSVEHRFGLDVNGEPVEITRETTDISHQLIEECMLLANRAVATWLLDHNLPCVFRIHEQPDEDRIAQFARYLEVYGLDSSTIQNRFGLQKMLDRLKQEPPTARLVLNYLCLRSFKKAVYAVENIGHYALAFANYCHFTSPIRRYPDLLVHRLVKRALHVPGFEKVEIRRGYLDALARQSSNLEQRAEAAERDLHARKSARYLAARLGEVFPGVVTGASGGGLTVQLMETGMEGFLPMRELKDDFYRYDGDRMALVGDRSGRVIGIGTEVDAQVVAVDIVKADVVLGLADSTRLGRQPEAPRRQQADERPPGGDQPPRRAEAALQPLPTATRGTRRGDQPKLEERPRRTARPLDPVRAAAEAKQAAKAARRADKLAARKASHEERKAKRGDKPKARDERKKKK